MKTVTIRQKDNLAMEQFRIKPSLFNTPSNCAQGVGGTCPEHVACVQGAVGSNRWHCKGVSKRDQEAEICKILILSAVAEGGMQSDVIQCQIYTPKYKCLSVSWDLSRDLGPSSVVSTYTAFTISDIVWLFAWPQTLLWKCRTPYGTCVIFENFLYTLWHLKWQQLLVVRQLNWASGLLSRHHCIHWLKSWIRHLKCT